MVAAFATINGDKVGGVAHAGNRIQQRGADPGKDGAVGGDSQGQREHSYESEAGRLREDAEGITDVVNRGSRPSR
jgi:hypothetical protein